MSHVTMVGIVVKDLDALEAAAKELGGALVRNVSRYERYHVDCSCDEKESSRSCTHVIRVKGVRYEVGVVKQGDGSFLLALDPYSGRGFTVHAGQVHDGAELVKVFGKGAKLLGQAYAKHAVVRAYTKRGYRVTVEQGKAGSPMKLVAVR